MYEVYAEKTGTNVVRPPNPTYTSSTTDDIDLWSYVSTHRSAQCQHLVGSSSSSSLPHSNDTLVELVMYFAHDVLSMLDDEERKNFDILRWWRQHQRSYPILFKMARDLLTHPVSTIASKAAFSTSDRVLSDIRSRLKVDILESLLYLKDWDDAKLRIHDKVDRIISEELEDLNMD
ncbi:BED zinc finger [Abeliophyllum distichum]|uniref:BED zinc finger n=1 Tax=Abeliophyllum distichum TaxID=126358 RepID=A0ABD1TYP6_9LAMI